MNPVYEFLFITRHAPLGEALFENQRALAKAILRLPTQNYTSNPKTLDTRLSGIMEDIDDERYANPTVKLPKLPKKPTPQLLSDLDAALRERLRPVCEDREDIDRIAQAFDAKVGELQRTRHQLIKARQRLWPKRPKKPNVVQEAFQLYARAVLLHARFTPECLDAMQEVKVRPALLGYLCLDKAADLAASRDTLEAFGFTKRELNKMARTKRPEVKLALIALATSPT